MKKIHLKLALVCALMIVFHAGFAMPPARQIFELRIYTYKTVEQEQGLDKYIKGALLPALHKNSVNNVGVFKPITNTNDTARKLYIVIPYSSFDQAWSVTEKVSKDATYQSAAKEYLETPYDHPAYTRIEKIFARAFPGAPTLQPTPLKGPRSERIYELRSYESASETLHEKKVKMFNDGNEIGIFKRLGFNAVFYSQALTGTALPNLLYMTTFDNQESHDKLWKDFGSDPEWKKLSALDEYQHTVSKADIYLLRPTDYSDY